MGVVVLFVTLSLEGEYILEEENSLIEANILLPEGSLVGENSLGYSLVGENVLSLDGQNNLPLKSVLGEVTFEVDKFLVGDMRLEEGNSRVGENILVEGIVLVGDSDLVGESLLDGDDEVGDIKLSLDGVEGEPGCLPESLTALLRIPANVVIGPSVLSGMPAIVDARLMGRMLCFF